MLLDCQISMQYYYQLFSLTVPLKIPKLTPDIEDSLLVICGTSFQDGGVLVPSLFNKTVYKWFRFDHNNRLLKIILRIQTFILIYPSIYHQEDVLFVPETSLLAHIKFKDGYIVDIYEVDGGNL